MKNSKLLIVEDDPVLNDQLGALLREAGFDVDQCTDGNKGLELGSSQPYQLILLDVMLPGIDGFSLLRMLRKTCQTPVIMITAKGAEEERIKGLSQGADDYVTKPFNTTELVLRIEALLRRTQPESATTVDGLLSLDGLEIDRLQQSAFAHKQLLDMTPIEF